MNQVGAMENDLLKNVQKDFVKRSCYSRYSATTAVSLPRLRIT